jgi:hypothetical protein
MGLISNCRIWLGIVDIFQENLNMEAPSLEGLQK